VEVKDGDKIRIITMEEFVIDGIKGTYKSVPKREGAEKGPGAYHGIVFVPNIVPQTPPYVDRVLAGSPAYKKLLPDDLLVYVDGEPVYTIQAFRDMMTKLKPGAKIQLEVRRGDKLTAVEIELTEFPSNKKP
jgi:serine protease Do